MRTAQHFHFDMSSAYQNSYFIKQVMVFLESNAYQDLSGKVLVMTSDHFTLVLVSVEDRLLLKEYLLQAHLFDQLDAKSV